MARWALHLLTILLIVACWGRWARGQTSLPADSQADLMELVGGLDAAQPTARRETEDRLRALGPAAIQVLRAAQATGSPELTERAARLIEELQGQMLFGAEATLTADRQTLRWDEPLTLRLTLRNPNDWPVRSPLLPDPPESVSDLIRNTGRFFDLIDSLQVTGPDGQPLEVHLDHLLDEWELRRTLERRFEDAARVNIPPGQSLEVVLCDVNRGYARLRLLSKGRYRFEFCCDPAWTKPALAAKGVGQVRSNVVEVEVTESAPDLICDSRVPAVTRLTLERGDLVLRLQSAYDVPFHVNTNYGQDIRFAASIILNVEQDEQRVRLALDPLIAGGQQLQAERFRLVTPGQTLELARLDWPTLCARRELAELQPAKPCLVQATYRNLCSRAMLEHRIDAQAFSHLSPDQRALVEALPERVYAGMASSKPLTISLATR